MKRTVITFAVIGVLILGIITSCGVFGHKYKYEIDVMEDCFGFTGVQTTLADSYEIKDGVIYYTNYDGKKIISNSFTIISK